MATSPSGILALALDTRLPHTAPRPAIVRFPLLGGFAHWILHSLSTTTTANLPSHQPSRWPRNAQELCSAPTVATYVHHLFPWQYHVWSFVFRSKIFELGPVEGARSTRTIRHCDDNTEQENRSMEEQLERGGSRVGLRSCGRKSGHWVDPTKLQSPT